MFSCRDLAKCRVVQLPGRTGLVCNLTDRKSVELNFLKAIAESVLMCSRRSGAGLVSPQFFMHPSSVGM